jgi:long-chain acyl-CoA synthetase
MQGTIFSGARRLSREDLIDRAARAASGFDALGIAENDAIALMLRNDFTFFEAAFGAAHLGAYAVPVNWHFTAEEAGYIMRDCAARALVVHADLLPLVMPAIPNGVGVMVVATPPEIADAYCIDRAQCAVPSLMPQGWQDWNDWVEGQVAWTAPPKASRTNMIYTSGTTGQPKGVRRQPATAEMQQAMARMVEAAFDLGPDRTIRTVITGPVYHSAPNYYALVAVTHAELVVLQPRFDAEQLLQMIEQYRITHLHMVPTMFVRLLKLPEGVRRKYDLTSLRCVAHGAAPCSVDVKRQMIEWWGPVIREYYGGTETGVVVTHNSEEALRRLGTVGRAIEGAIVRVYDAEGHQLAPDEVGEIFLRVSQFPDFTYHGMDERRREVERDGLISCGDIGYLDEDGYLFLCDRARDMVISGGVNIYPAEIEGILVTMPGVQDCAVFGIPDDEFGEALCACIQPQGGAELTVDDVRDFVRRHLARYKVPNVIEFVAALPREDSGKIFKRKLRAPYWEKAGRQI